MNLRRQGDQYAHMVLCAVFTNGCQSMISWKSYNKEMDESHLTEHGWRLDHGKWVCPKHPVKLDYDREDIPVTVNFNIDRPIGTASLREDAHGMRVDMYITDPEIKTFLMDRSLSHLSINTGHFVRDKDKERKLPWQQK